MTFLTKYATIYVQDMKNTDYKAIPASPGIYLFTGKNGKPLYIGKAVNLRSRVKTYFQNKSDNLRINKMVETARKVRFVQTNSEIEALILESQYIKKYKPDFNVMLRDDKQYFYAVIIKEDFPRIYLTHQMDKRVKAEYTGPFTDGSSIKSTLKLLRRIFPYCTCKQKHNNYCLNYHIGNCPGFCCLKNVEDEKKKKKEYSLNIKAVKQILTGKKNNIVKTLNKEMMIAARKEDFERSIEIQNQISKLETVFENAKIISDIQAHKRDSVLSELEKTFNLPEVPQRIEGYDISNIQGIFATASMVVFNGGKADKSQYRKFKIRIDGKADDTGMIKEALNRRLNHPEWPLPSLILVDGGKGQLNSILSVLEKRKLDIPVISLTKDSRHKGSHVYSSLGDRMTLRKMPDSVKNLILQIDSEAHRFAIAYYRKLHSRSQLDSKSIKL